MQADDKKKTGGTVSIPSSRALVGQVLDGRYRIMRKIGEGGMAWVYCAWDQKEDAPVAVKVLLPSLAEKPDLCKRFVHEAKIQGQLQHPHIVRIVDSVSTANSAAMVMEWIDGEDVAGLLERVSLPLPAMDIWQVMEPILAAMDYAHSQQIIHRDLKPENFLVHWEDGLPIVKVTDFGIAKALGDLQEEMTKTGAMMGTIRYMSHEQLKSTKSVDHRADIYSLGVTLYYMATGDFPFVGAPMTIMGNIINRNPPLPPTSHHPDLHPELASLILKSIHHDPDKRFQTCESFADALKQTLKSIEKFEDADSHLLPPSSKDLLPTAQEMFAETMMATKVGAFDEDDEDDDEDDDDEPTSPASSKGKTFALLGLVALLLVAVVAVLLWRPTKKPGSGAVKARPTCEQGTTRACYAGPPQAAGKGRCKRGKQACDAGKWGPCKGSVLPRESELCNGIDDNCDGKVDEAWPIKGKRCAVNFGECANPGRYRCHTAQKKVVCVATGAIPKGERRSLLTIVPKDVAFTLQRSGVKEKLALQGRYCFLHKGTKRRSIRVRITARGYHRCRFSFRHSARRKSIIVKMKKRRRGQLEPPSAYCRR